MVLNEKMMQFILENKLYYELNLRTTCSKKITIKFLGILNPDQGPDFIHSRVFIDNTEWAGNIELHVNTSDWVLHQHHLDKNYINVVLHIVWKHDSDKFIQSHVLILSDYVNNKWQESYFNKIHENQFRPCFFPLKINLSSQTIEWVNTFGQQKIDKKTERIFSILKSVNGNWEEVSWRIIASNFGYRVNSETFFQIACSIPYKLIYRLKNDPISIESLLMGQAGLLNHDFNDDHPILLKSSYSRLKSIYSLKEIYRPLYFLRMRPQNFPTLRLSQLANFFSMGKSIFELIEHTKDINSLSEQIRVTASAYWDCHYLFDRLSKEKTKYMGIQFSYNIIINSIIPLLVSYGLSTGRNSYLYKARDWLDSIPPQTTKNIYFLKTLINPKNAFQSQAALELYNTFCIENKCNECKIRQDVELQN